MLKIILPNKNCLRPCFGIERTIKKCLNVRDKREFLIYGQLGHNKSLCNYLEKAGLITFNDLKKVKNKKVIIRTHGINKNDLDFLEKNKIQFIDLTCPYVKKFLNMSLKYEKDGCQIIIVGNKDDDEIKNVCSFLNNPIIVNDEIDVKKIPFFSKIAVLTQTTQTLKKIKNLFPLIKQKCNEIIYIETRCPETEQRQEEAIELAGKVDLILVVGDKISRNANNLIEVCKDITKTRLVQGAADINKISFGKFKKVGVISSALTPSFIVKDIIQSLKNKMSKKI